MSKPKPETISRLLNSAYPLFAFQAGLELDLFTPLQDRPLTLNQLAERLDVNPIKLRPVVYILVYEGLLKLEEDRFSNTPEADYYLVKGQARYLGGMAGLNTGNWTKMLKASETIRNNGPLEGYDYHTGTEELTAVFRGLYQGASTHAYHLMKHHDFSEVSSVLDVGGGSGALAMTLAEVHSHLEVEIFDLPSITPITQTFVDEQGMDDRVNIISGDAVEGPIPGAYDVAVASQVIQVLGPEQAEKVILNMANALNPGGTLHLIGMILDDSRLSPDIAVYGNLLMMSIYPNGEAYTETEYRGWMTDAGLDQIERVILPGGMSLISGRKR